MPVPPPSDATRVFHGLLYDIYQAPRRQYDGTTKTFEYLTRPDSVTIFPFLGPDTLLLTRQEQPGKEPFYDFPGGRVDEGESPEVCAARELLEETGYRAGQLTPIWHYALTGSSRFEKSFFIATDLRLDGQMENPDKGERIEVLAESVERITQRCLAYELRQFDAMLCFLSLYLDPAKRQIMDSLWRK